MKNQINIFSGAALITAERNEQIVKHRRTIKHDITNNRKKELVTGAMAIIHCEVYMWPKGWSNDYRKHVFAKPYKERLIIAGALLAAEIDRVNELENAG